MDIICLLWIGCKLDAPFWYFVLILLGAVLRTLRVLGKKKGKIYE